MLEKRLRNLNDGQERTGMQGGCYVNIDRNSLSRVKTYILNRVMFGAEAEVGEAVDELIKSIESLADFHNDFVHEYERSKRNSEWARYDLEKIIPDKI